MRSEELAGCAPVCAAPKNSSSDLSIPPPLVRHTSRGRKRPRGGVDMTRHTSKQTVKSFVGSALVGPGLSIFFGNLLWAAAQLSHLLGQTAGESLGVLPLVPWAASLGPSAPPAHSAAHVLAPPAPHRRSRPARRRARRRPIDRPKLSNSSPVGGHVWPGYQPRVPHSCAFLCIRVRPHARARFGAFRNVAWRDNP